MPSSTISGKAPTRNATIGLAARIASRATRPKASQRDGMTTRSATSRWASIWLRFIQPSKSDVARNIGIFVLADDRCSDDAHVDEFLEATRRFNEQIVALLPVEAADKQNFGLLRGPYRRCRIERRPVPRNAIVHKNQALRRNPGTNGFVELVAGNADDPIGDPGEDAFHQFRYLMTELRRLARESPAVRTVDHARSAALQQQYGPDHQPRKGRMDVNDIRLPAPDFAQRRECHSEQARKIAAFALEYRDFRVFEADEVVAMVGWNDVVHISAAEAGALKRMQFVEVGRNAATNGFSDMQHPQSSVLSDRHTSILFVLAAAQSLIAFYVLRCSNF